MSLDILSTESLLDTLNKCEKQYPNVSLEGKKRLKTLIVHIEDILRERKRDGN